MSNGKLSLGPVPLLLGLLVTALLATSTAFAQTGSTNTTFTFSTSRTPDTFSDTVLPTLRVDTFQTRLLGLLQGDPTLYFDQTYAAPFADPVVTAGLSAAMMALTTANAGDPLGFLGPTLDGSTSSLLSSSTLITPVGAPVLTETASVLFTIGPGSLSIGDLGNCEGVGELVGLPSSGFYPFNCTGGSPVLRTVLAGQQNLNTNLNSQFLFTREIQTTETYQVFDTWRLVGVPQTVSVPEPGTLPLLGLGLLALLGAGRLRRDSGWS